MNRDELEVILRDEVVFTSEAASILGVTPQAINNLVYRGRLIPIRIAQGANLFARSDIENYRASKRKAAAVEPVKIWGDGSTRKAVEIIEALDPQRRAMIETIALYRDADDAVADGYVVPVWPSYPDDQRLIATVVPQCVIKFDDGEEIWLRGLSTGYKGTGPGGAYHVMTKILGIREEDAHCVYSSSIARYHCHQGKWYLAEAVASQRSLKTFRLSYYFHCAKLVVAAELYPEEKQEQREDIIIRIAQHIQRPDHVEILSRPEAIARGTIIRDYCGAETIFQVIIHDQTGRQAWICIPIQDKLPLHQTASLQELLNVLEVPIPEPENSARSDVFSRVMHLNLPVFNFWGGKKNAEK